MPKETKIEIGDVAACKITGFKGVVTAYSSHLSNCDRVALQPRELKDDGTPKDCLWFDLPQCDLLEKNVVTATPLIPITFKSGDKVKHTLTKLTGTVIGVTRWINGCVRIGIQGSDLDENKGITETEWIAQNELELIEKTVEVKTDKKPGGPMKAPKSMSNPK